MEKVVEPTTILRKLGVGHRNPSVEVFDVELDGCTVPYVEVVRWPCVWDGGCPHQAYPAVDLDAREDEGTYEYVVHWDGDWCWTATVDHRMAYDFKTREELEYALRLAATLSAVAAGVASHGSAYRLNPHGPSFPPARDPLVVPGTSVGS